MRKLYIIAGAALIAAFVIGCSKSASVTPTAHFVRYKVESDGTTYAMMDIRNPSSSQIVCQVEVQPAVPRGGPSTTVVPAGGSVNFGVYVGETTNGISLNATFFKTVPTYHVAVPMQ